MLIPFPLLAPVILALEEMVHEKVELATVDDKPILKLVPLQIESMLGVAVAAGIGLTVMV